MHSLKIIHPGFFTLTPFKAFLLISLLCLVVYFPSLFHVARGDQVNYFADVAVRGTQSWVRLALLDFDLNRTRAFAQGDAALFRPGLYFLLGTETYLFRYDFVLWQAFGILCHLAVVWWLLKLTWLIRPGYVAAGCAAVFAVMTAHMEMVIWHHISAYMVFIVLTLMGIYHLLAYQQDRVFRHVWLSAVALGCSIFFYEAGLVFMILMLGYAAWIRMERKFFLLFCVIIGFAASGYGLWNMLNAPVTGFKSEIDGVMKHGRPQLVIENMFLALGWWFYAGLLPFKAGLRTVSRMMASGVHSSWVIPCMALAFGSIALVSAGVWMAVRRAGKMIPRHGALMLLLGLMILVVAGIIALGRMNAQEPRQALSVATYYGYFFWVFMMVLLVAWVDHILHAQPLRLPWRWVVGVLFAILLTVNTLGTFRINLSYADASRDILLLTRSVEDFIRQHEGEKDFSFFIPTQWPNYEVSWLVKGAEPLRKFSYVEVMFPKYFRQERPKYTLKMGR